MKDERLEGATVVASISGGKDSAAMSLWLTEQGIEHQRVFADTGWESDVTYAYIRDVLEPKIGPIHWLIPEMQMEELCTKKGMFPSRIRRWCTEKLKVIPIRNFIRELGGPVVNTVGIRAGESEARSKLPEWEWSNDWDAWIWRPLMSWSFDDVVAIHKRHGLEPNPLYIRGAQRVGCWPCIFARKAEVRMISERDPARIQRIYSLENTVAHEAEARLRAKGESLEAKGHHAPTFFQKWDEGDGHGTMWPIAKVVEWAQTSRGGRQKELFALEADGCMRWGLCDTLHDDEETA